MNRTTTRKNTRKNASRTYARKSAARSPEAIRKKMSDNVRRGVAIVTGVVEGYAGELKDSHLPQNAEQAVHLTGQTARRFAETGAYEIAETRRRIQAASRGLAAGAKRRKPSRKRATKRASKTSVSLRGGRGKRLRGGRTIRRRVSRKVKVAARIR